MKNLENNICFPFGMIHKIRFSLIECDDSQIICYLFSIVVFTQRRCKREFWEKDSKAKESKF